MSQTNNLVPSLRQAVETAGLDPNRLSVAMLTNANGPARITDRHSIPLAQLEEVYSSFRRRPDGRSLGPTHDFIWQVAALLLATWPLSEAQFTSIFGALEKSTRKWALRPVSRFYLAYLRQTFGQV
jgi:hypothetical protein